MSGDTLIFNFTANQLTELIREAVTKTIDERLEERMPKVMEHNIAGLARVIGCSKDYAQKLKNKGVFSKSVTQRGRRISVDVAEAQREWLEYQARS